MIEKQSDEESKTLAQISETLAGVSFGLELLWERLQEPEGPARAQIRSAVWATVAILKESVVDLERLEKHLIDLSTEQ